MLRFLGGRDSQFVYFITPLIIRQLSKPEKRKWKQKIARH